MTTKNIKILVTVIILLIVVDIFLFFVQKSKSKEEISTSLQKLSQEQKNTSKENKSFSLEELLAVANKLGECKLGDEKIFLKDERYVDGGIDIYNSSGSICYIENNWGGSNVNNNSNKSNQCEETIKNIKCDIEFPSQDTISFLRKLRDSSILQECKLGDERVFLRRVFLKDGQWMSGGMGIYSGIDSNMCNPQLGTDKCDEIFKNLKDCVLIFNNQAKIDIYNLSK